MLQDIDAAFDNHYAEKSPRSNDCICIFDGAKLMLALDDKMNAELPTFDEVGMANKTYTFLFTVGETDYFLQLSDSEEPFGRFGWVHLSRFREIAQPDIRFVCLVAHHLHHWYVRNRFCGKCGARTVLDHDERMIRCPQCDNMIFPKISPGIIVGIINGNKLLMSHYVGREYSAFALIAGFTEIGETIEDTVRREVMEEVGLQVKNITFYKSQPWPPSSSILCGFFAELDGSDRITVDTTELADAGWYTADEVPSEPHAYSLTREMMTVFVEHADDPSVLLGN